LASLVLFFYSAWNDTDGKDETITLDEATEYDLSADGSVLLDDLIGPHFNDYRPSGTRISSPLNLDPVGIVESTSISWEATVPASTSLTVETSLDGGVTWQTATNGGSIPGISPGDNLEGKTLLVRQTLSTSDTTVTPQLHSLTVTLNSLEEYLLLGEFKVDTAIPRKDERGNRITVIAYDGARNLDQTIGQVLTYTDSPSSSADYAKDAGASASATSEIGIGDEIQRQCSISYEAYGTIGGNRTALDRNDASSNTNIRQAIDHSTTTEWEYRYNDTSGQGFTDLEVILYLDLGLSQAVQSVTVNFGSFGSLSSVEESTDGSTWSTFTSGDTLRYLKITVKGGPDASITEAVSRVVQITEIQLATAVARPASNAIDGDTSTAWQPSWTDVDRELTIDLGTSRSFNQIYCAWGTDDNDLWNRVKYQILTSTDGTNYTKQTELMTTRSGKVEHYFASTLTAQYVKIKVTSAEQAPLLRDVQVRNITATNTISYLIDQLATNAGETKKNITDTWEYYPYTIGWPETDTYMTSIVELANSIGWEAYYSYDGKLTVGKYDPNPHNPDWTFQEGVDNILLFEPTFTDRDIINKVKYVGRSANFKPISYTAEDDNINSPTSTKRIGVKYIAYYDDLANTQAKVEAGAKRMLREGSKVTVPLHVRGTPNFALEPGDVVRVIVGNFDEVYTVESLHFTIDAEGVADMSLELGHIPR